jgi:hypothetical protein
VTGIQVLKTVQESTAGTGSSLAASYGHAYQVGAGAALCGVALAAVVRNSRPRPPAPLSS